MALFSHLAISSFDQKRFESKEGGQVNKLIDIFCDVDDFCHKLLPVWESKLIADGVIKRRQQSKVSTSECMTIVIAFHQSNQSLHGWVILNNRFVIYIYIKHTFSMK
jgi:hypothetical protein